MRKLIYYGVIPLGLIYLASKLSTSNTAYIRYEQQSTQDKDNWHLISIRHLSKMVDANFLDREYYEVMMYNDMGTGWWANYNKAHQTLIISGEPLSGWWGCYSATPAELKMIADKQVVWTELDKYLKPYQPKRSDIFPTRNGKILYFF